MSQQIYLKNGNKFWDCELRDDSAVIIRIGMLLELPNKKYEEKV